MLSAINELGRLKLSLDKEGLIDIFVENPNLNNKYNKVILIVFEIDKDKVFYKDVELEDFSNEKITRYLYKKGTPNGTDYTPTCKITELKKTYENKIERWFEKVKKEFKNELEKDEPNKLIEKVSDELSKNKDEILKEVEKRQSQIKDSSILTIVFEENGERKYIGDFEIFNYIFEKLVEKNYKESLKKNEVCALCGEVKEVSGNSLSNIFKFYTIDKPGYISGLNEKLAWRNAPICFDCSKNLEKAKKYLEESLKFKLAGYDYYLIPKFIFNTKEAKEIIFTFFNYIDSREDIIKEKQIERLTNDEKEILEQLSELQDFVTYNFLFFETSNSQFKIHLLIEDVLPSRISRIFEAKKITDSNPVFKNIKVGKNYYNIEFKIDILKTFFKTEKIFFDIVYKIFRGIPLDRDLLFSNIMKKIRKKFIENELNLDVLSSFSIYLFLSELNLIKNPNKGNHGGEIMMDKLDEFLKQNKITNPEHKAVFSLGILCEKLLNIQYSIRGSKPFIKNLKGLKMKEHDFKALFPKIQNKLYEYNANYFKELEETISNYFIEAGSNWKTNFEELNFYFVLGMNLANKIMKENKEEK